MFGTAVKDGLIIRNPVESIELPVKTKKPNDPFTVGEANQIVEHLYKTLTHPMRIYAADFEFAFYTGMRPSEIAALRWEEVDKEKRLVNVCRIVANYKIEKHTKTWNLHQVVLNIRALHALEQAELGGTTTRLAEPPQTRRFALRVPANQEPRVHSTIECDRQTRPGCIDRIGDSRPPAIQLPTHIRYHVPHGGYEPCVYCHSARS